MTQKSQLVVTEIDGAELVRCDTSSAPDETLFGAVHWAVHSSGLRDAYLLRYQITPGPICLSVSLPGVGLVRGGRLVLTGIATLSVMRRGPHCGWEDDPSTMRRLLVRLERWHDI